VPDGVTVVANANGTLNDMLLAWELDAVTTARPPAEFERGTGRIVRLFSDYRTTEAEWYRRTGVFPIVHVIALRADVHRRNPWIAMNLVTALEAKRRSLERMLDFGAPRIPVPSGPANSEQARPLIGGDPWPYGIEPNPTTLDAFLLCCRAGVCARRLAVEELFIPEAQAKFSI